MSNNIIETFPIPESLPATYAISLTQYSAISLSGEDKSSYLQGQVTCDVNLANESTLIRGAHCDSKGKVYSVFRLINRDDAHLLLQPKSSIELSLAALKKFGVFAKVTIEEVKELSFFALIGEQASTLIQDYFNIVPDSLTPVIHVGTTTLVYLPGKQARYIIVDHTDSALKIMSQFGLDTYSNEVWQLTEIQEGFPTLAQSSLEQYVPQMLNLQAIHGISFTKGCYLGQETVARMQYLGKNKRALFALSANKTNNKELVNSAIKPSAGDIIEKKLGDNWRKAGDVLAAYVADGQIDLQAVLANDVNSDTVFRLKNQPENLFSLVDLPYSLNQEN